MIEVKGINAVSLVVRDVEASLQWYREKLGFEKLFDDAPNSPSVVIGRGGVEVVLRPLENPAEATNVNTKEQACIAILAFEVEPDQLDKVEQVFIEDADIVQLDEHPKYRSRIVEDPDGHAIEFYANVG